MAVMLISRRLDMFPDREDIVDSALGFLCAWLDTHFIFAVDTETEGFMNFQNKVIMLQIGDADTQFVIDTRGLDVSCLRKYFESKRWKKIFHNAKFDVNFLRFTFGFRTESVYDTFLAECCITNGIEGRSLGLAALTSKYCDGAMLDKTERGRFVGLGSKPYTHSNIIYGARDVQFLHCIMDAQAVIIQEMLLEEVVQLENEVVLALCDIEYNGMFLDASKWMELANKAMYNIAGIEKELDQMVMNNPKLKVFRRKYVQSDIFGEVGKCTTVKWSAPLQVAKVLKALGIVFESTSEKEITKFQNTYPLVKKFIDYKHEQKLATTYGPDFLQYINKYTGRIHTNFWQILDTHRLSSSEPNLQQIPAKKEYLACFTAPLGYRMVNADFAGQELRIIAQGSQDPLWLLIFNENRDLHGEIAAKLFNIPLEEVKKKPEYETVGETKVFLRGKSTRDITKTVNFMLAFGGSKFKLSDTLGIELSAADTIIEGYFILVPKVKQFLESCAKYGLKNKRIRSFKPYSIVRQFYNLDLSDRKAVGEVERASKNTAIQATGSMMTKLAMVAIREKIKEMPYSVEMIMQIHDAIICYAPTEYAEEWGKIQKEIMEEAGREWLHSVPCISDMKVSIYWEK